jgi:hypothetical protein
MFETFSTIGLIIFAFFLYTYVIISLMFLINKPENGIKMNYEMFSMVMWISAASFVYTYIIIALIYGLPFSMYLIFRVMVSYLFGDFVGELMKSRKIHWLFCWVVKIILFNYISALPPLHTKIILL